MVAVKEAVTADGAFIHLADTQRQLVAQRRAGSLKPSPRFYGTENGGHLIGAFRARLLNGIQEGTDASVKAASPFQPMSRRSKKWRRRMCER